MTKEVELQLGYIMRIFERNKVTLSLTDSDLVKGVIECAYLQGKADAIKELKKTNKNQ